MKKILPFFLIVGIVLIFFWQLLLKGLLPIPSDTIVGLYYPFREIYLQTNPNGVAYKNFLITDPVRQQYPWKQIAIETEKKINLPTWNPYNFAGTPLLANFQSSVFYPFNILFFIFPFQLSWSMLILFEPLFAGIFLFLYLNNLRLRKEASLLGAITFSFSGFSIAWMEWGTVTQTALWLPLILLSIDKIFQYSIRQPTDNNHKSKLIWSLVFLLALISSFFAGHLQTFFYLGILSLIYFLARFFQHGRNIKSLILFFVLFSLFLILSFVQWFPMLKFVMESARNIDLIGWKELGWFIPWQNLIQFIAPDFFGNPATLNYYGIWNYGEFIGYVGIFPLIVGLLALFFRKDKKTLFFGTAFFASLIFALPTFFAKLPFILNLPFLSTAQPTRLVFIIDFSLAVLAALGFDYFLSVKSKKILYILGALSVVFLSLWFFVLSYSGSLISIQNMTVARQNLIFPTAIFVLISSIIFIYLFLKTKKMLFF